MRVQAAAQAEVEASPTILRQAIENLTDNAAAHGGPGAVEVDVRADPADGQVEVVVADRGAAEAPEGGHGIGLFVVRRFLDEAGATSWVAPRDGGGTLVGLRAAAASRQTGIHWTTPSTPGTASRGERSMRQPVRVVLADDHDAFVEGLGMVLAQDDLEAVALAGDLPGPPGRPHPPTRRAGGRHPDARPGRHRAGAPGRPGRARDQVLLLAEDAWLALSSRPDPGGHTGMTRAVSARELAEAIRAVAAGFRVTLADCFPDRPERDDHAELLLRSLSERERQVLALLARGYSNRRIADACFLSLNTVRTHVQNVLVKLGVHSKLEAAALAVRQGLVSIEGLIA